MPEMRSQIKPLLPNKAKRNDNSPIPIALSLFSTALKIRKTLIHVTLIYLSI